MLHTIGDSHAWAPYLNISGTKVHHLGPVTMKRIGHPSENLLLDTFASIRPKPTAADTVLLCFGEIDIRCWIHVYVTQRKREPEGLLREWTAAYLDKSLAIASAGPKVAIQAIVPPRTDRAPANPNFPYTGSDAERAEYTRLANRLLEEGCRQRGLLFVDAYTPYTDGYGMMRPDLVDSSVHINDTRPLRSVLASLGLIPPPDRQ